MPAKITMLPGSRFGRLTILADDPVRKPDGLHWICRCDCGTTRAFAGHRIRLGKTVSCGCYHADLKRAAKYRLTHGGTGSPEYGAWRGMQQRCGNPRSAMFASYGARGITVCPAWREFAAFFRDMGPRPSPEHSLERVDNDRGYSPDNCRWATRAEQARNKTTTVKLTYQGTTLRLSEWAERTGIPWGALRNRMRAGWPPERTVTTPVRRWPKDADG